MLMDAKDTEKEAEEEQTHFRSVIAAFQQYAPYTVCPCAPLTHAAVLNDGQLAGNNRRRKDIFVLPLEDQALVEQLGYKKKLAEVDDAILANAAFLNQVIANPEIFENNVGDNEADLGEGLDEPPDEGLLANQ
jgi:carnosine N-methyltransferase